MNNQRDFKGVWIPAEIWLCEGLSLIEKCLLIEIDSLSNLKRGCIASNAHFAQFLGVTPGRASQLISCLKKKGYVKTWVRYKPNTKQVDERRIYTTPLFKKLKGGIENPVFGPSEVVRKLKGGIEKIKGGYLENYRPPLENAQGKDNSISNTIRSNTDIKKKDSKKNSEPDQTGSQSEGITCAEFCALYGADPTQAIEGIWMQMLSRKGAIEKISEHAPAYYQSNEREFLKNPENYLRKEEWKMPILKRKKEKGSGQKEKSEMSYAERNLRKRRR